MESLASSSPSRLAGADFFAPLREETHFYIVRHGQSEGNARRILQGRLDLPLDAAGRGQAAALGAWLAGEGIDAVLSSPLVRAAETGRIVAAAAGLAAPEPRAALVEIDVGVFSGISLDEARERFPEAYVAFESRSWDGVPGAEGSGLLYERAMDAWEELRALALGGKRNIVAVSHGGFIQWLVHATFGCRSWMPLVPTGNCGVFELLVSPTRPGEPAYLQWRRLNFQAPEVHIATPPVF